ncbi:hypothetical protein [Paenibacillus sp. YYML68]|uniref:hypothetical protein n=1 Tax=Paenibacillus sp. YYML68 TaxID=2909250 RepID=UPI002490B649|nr:hypothetical protein [Paenibacillus sp. YYML68]
MTKNITVYYALALSILATTLAYIGTRTWISISRLHLADTPPGDLTDEAKLDYIWTYGPYMALILLVLNVPLLFFSQHQVLTRLLLLAAITLLAASLYTILIYIYLF